MNLLSIDVKEKKDPAMHKGTCLYLVRKGKKEYFDKLDPRNVTDNEKVCQSVKPFTDKGMNQDKIILVEDYEIISEKEQISESLNNFFADAIINLNIPSI